jgi:hypothetical protein
VKIKIERTGGFTGLSSSNEIEVDKLPVPLDATVRELIDRRKLPQTKSSRKSKVGADYLSYKIIIKNGIKDRTIECNEIEMDSNLKLLVRYVQKNSIKEQST